MKKLLLVCLHLALTLVNQRLHAQNYVYATGSPSFSTQIPIENGFINVNNGEIHIEIPLAEHPQRGKLQLNERLTYDSRIWKIISNGGYSWSPTNVPNSMGGWVFSSGNQPGTASYSSQNVSWFNCLGAQYGGMVYNAFTWTDPQGTAHEFSPQTAQQYRSPPVKCNNPPSFDTPSASGSALDGSGYFALVDHYYGLTVYDRNGSLVSSGSMRDSNGNYMSTDSGGNLIDTLGRTPVLSTPDPNNSSVLYYDVLTANGGRARYTVTTESVSFNTAFRQSAVRDVSGSFTAIQSLQLPDGSTYTFGYDSGSYGELTSVTLPTGGMIQYGYANFLDSFNNQNRWLHTRIKDGGTTTFTPATISNCTSSAGCREKNIVTGPSGDDIVYTFTLDKGSVSNAGSWNSEIDAWQGSSTGTGTKLKSVVTSNVYYQGSFFTHNLSQSTLTPYQTLSSAATTTVLPDVGLTSQTVVTNPGTAPSVVKIWDYFPSSGGAPATANRETDYNYNYASNYYGVLLGMITVKDGSGNQLSQTTYTYDETTGPGHAALVPVSGLPQQPSAVTGGRGNLTTTSQWVNTGGTLSTEATYDTAGTMLTSTDVNGTTSYGHDSSDTFTTNITPPTPSSGVSLPSSATYDFSTGLLLTTTDPNGTQTLNKSYDAFGRATEVDIQDSGGIAAGKTTASYSSTLASVHNYQNASVFADIETLNDGYGRRSRGAVLNGQGSHAWYQQDTCYDASGNANFSSYQYQADGWATTKVCTGAGGHLNL